MSDKHTPEPWFHHAPSGSQHAMGGYINASEERDAAAIAHICGSGFSEDEYHANARRIVACVNACRGLPTDELEQKGLVAAVGTELLALDTKLAAVTNTRDQLLGVMDGIADVLEELSLEDSQSRLKGGAAGIASGIRKSIVAIVSSSL